MLDNYRVIDLTDRRGWMAGFLLAQLGCDVVLAEPANGWERDHWFEAYNRGKRSVTIRSTEDVSRLAAEADFVIDCGATAFPIDLEKLRSDNPSLITVSLTPFGDDGPKASWSATDLTIVAASGQMICNGDGDRPPVRISIPQAWSHASCQAVVGALVASDERSRSGLGQHVDVSAQQAMSETALPANLHGPAGLAPQERMAGGVQQGPVHLRWTYPCADGEVVITVAFGAMIGPMFQRFMDWMCEEGACDEATRDKDWVDFAIHIQQGTETLEELSRVMDLIADFAADKTKAEFLKESLERGLLVTPVTDLADVVESEQFEARKFWDEIEGIRHPGPFIQASETPLRRLDAAPTLGEHQSEVDVPRESASEIPEPSNGTRTDRPLEGLKVLDFSWVAAAPLSTKILAYWGAEVVRLESVTRPCLLRGALGHRDDVPDQENAIGWHAVNANKLSLAINLSKPEAKQVVLDLANWADVVVESFTPGTLESMGFGYEALKEINPGIIVLSSCVFGQTGPMKNFAGFGNLAAAVAGFYDITGWPDRGAAGPYMAYTDYTSPRFTTAALLAALDYRRRTGKGQYLDFSQAEAATHYLTPGILEYQTTGQMPTRAGNGDAEMVPHAVYPCVGEDQWCAIACENDDQWKSLCVEMRRDDLADLNLQERSHQVEVIDETIAAWTQGQSPGGLQIRLQRHGITAHMVQDTGDCMNDPQLVHRDHFPWVPHPEARQVMVDGIPHHLSRSQGGFDWAGPTYGQHAMEILEGILGYDGERIAELAVAEVLE
ncbi:MAG: CoA transferase [Acidimicrobiales bacterium]|jgi:crotonobetainyl-CoA:carnitine CoA-transferase CaiB-like acyl-CoA transferase|nr:CoA transferase [Acidimicrobiales bacterium]